jgi:hypothetical protein
MTTLRSAPLPEPAAFADGLALMVVVGKTTLDAADESGAF